MKKIGELILKWFCRTGYHSDIRGDLEELYLRRRTASGKFRADLMFLIAVVALMRPALVKQIKGPRLSPALAMTGQYIKASTRSFIKEKFHASINVFGLSIGIAAAILLYGYVSYERSFDQSYENQDRIYRVTNHSKFGDRIRTGITGSGLLAPTLQAEIPEVALAGSRHYLGQPVVQYKDRKFTQSRAYYADVNLPKILEYSYLEGDPSSALQAPNSVELSRSTADKIFGEERSIIGEHLNVNQVAMLVTGVIADVPANSNFVPEMLVSMPTMQGISWDRVGHVTYVLLEENISAGWIDQKMSEMVDRLELGSPEEGFTVWFDLFPIADIHLSTDPHQHGGGNLATVNALALIAILIVLIASINYMNLATARASRRAKEIGVRKVIGAARRQLAMQFMIEALLISFTSVAVGAVIAFLSRDVFVQISNVPATIDILDWGTASKLIALALAIGMLAGSYPALVLSSFKSVHVLKGVYADIGSKGLRKVLVSFQFVTSIILIISTIVIYNQLDYLRNKDLGFNQEAVYFIRLGKADQSEILKQQLLQHPGIISVAATNLMPATGDSGATFTIEDENGETSEDNVSMASVDNDYLDLMEMDVLQGKKFADDNGTSLSSIIVNEAMVKKYGWKEPLGKQIMIESDEEGGPMEKYVIEGVVRDFNMLSLYSAIQPFAFFKKPQFDWGRQYLLIKLASARHVEAISFIQEKFEAFEPEHVFSGRFLDEHLENIYTTERRTAEMLVIFSCLTIVIACLGLFGLASYTMEKRTKEISIRKVLGAGYRDIVGIVSREFLLIILVSSLIATPVAYYFMNKWLDSFSYHVEISMITMMSGAFLALIAAISTISFQAAKTLRTNPVDTLKCE